jgi:hypothetical protein
VMHEPDAARRRRAPPENLRPSPPQAEGHSVTQLTSRERMLRTFNRQAVDHFLLLHSSRAAKLGTTCMNLPGRTGHGPRPMLSIPTTLPLRRAIDLRARSTLIRGSRPPSEEVSGDRPSAQGA